MDLTGTTKNGLIVLGADGNPCASDTSGLLKRYPVTASQFHLIGKETERGWEQADDISILLPALIRYQKAANAAKQLLRQRLLQVSLDVLERDTGLSRHSQRPGRRDLHSENGARKTSKEGGDFQGPGR